MGGDGDDLLYGGTGPDAYDGGPGNDRLDVDGAGLDIRQSNELMCGPGADVVVDPSRFSVAPRDCEVVSFGSALQLRFAWNGPRVRVVASAPHTRPHVCRARVTFRRVSRRVGTVDFARVSARARSAALRLTPYGRRLLRRYSRILFGIDVSGSLAGCPSSPLERLGRFPAQF
jgi:hypothetical protein